MKDGWFSGNFCSRPQRKIGLFYGLLAHLRKTDAPAEMVWKDRLSLLAPADIEESTVKIGEIWELCTVLERGPDEYSSNASSYVEGIKWRDRSWLALTRCW
jgi:hypothetical protein